MGSGGDIRGILVHDSREKDRPVTYIAERGILAQTPVGTRLIMLDGTIETSAKSGQQLQVLHFESDTFSLDQFNVATRNAVRKMPERFLGELLSPSESDLEPRLRSQFFAEAHNRLSQPLFCIAFALIALAAVTRGRRQRGSIALRLTIASFVAAGLRIGAYGIMGIAQRNPAAVMVFYLLPLLGTAAAILVLMGYSPRALWQRWHSPHVAGAA
jgi:lipopolysaccharide export system permease protein